MTSKEDNISESFWETGWEGHELAQLNRLSKLPFAEKLKWLEDAHRLIIKMGKVECDRDI